MILLVAEKPSVANQHYRPMLERLEGEKFTQGDGCLIGKNHCITWCVGHLITLAPLDAYPGYEGGWRLSNLPLLPEKFRLMEIESTKKQLNVVRQMMEKADVLVNGADAGREGNLIFDLVLDYTPAFKQKQIKRLWVNSYVAKDLDKAWKNLEDATQRVNLSYAARLRQRADWMVGLNATRAYTLTAGRGKMISVGRVQTPTLNLVVERDALVEQFKELYYYSVVGTWKGYQAQYVLDDRRKAKDERDASAKESDKKSEGLKVAVFEKEAEANAVVERCKPPAPATIAKIDTQQKKQFPQKPFDLTELQKEGNKRFKFSAQQVLDCAQNLYEKKLLTYPRTDSQYLPDTMKQEAYSLAQKLASPEQKGVMRNESENFVFINSSKVTDHFAIIPTGETPNGLPEMEQKIYDLAKERFVQAWLKPYVWSEMEVVLETKDDRRKTKEGVILSEASAESKDPDPKSKNPDLFRLKLKRNEDLGFRALVKETKDDRRKTKGKKGNTGEMADQARHDEAASSDSKGDGDEITNLVEAFPEWNAGDTSPFDSVELQKKKKSKPKYYTEATLLAAMKTAGKQIENEELAEAMKDRGLGTPATQAGIIETLKKRGFIEAQKNYLVSTARGREVIALMDEKVKSPEMTGEWEYKLSQVEKGSLSPVEFRDGIVNYVKELFEHLREKYGSQFERETVTEAIACPKCGQPLEIAPWGYVCKNAECGFKTGHTIAGRMLSHSEMKQLLETRATPVLDGFISKKGTNFSAILKLDEEFKTVFEFPKRAFPKRDLPCPCCGDQLRFRKGTGEKGENLSAFVCPQCGYGIPQVFYQRKFSDEEVEGLLKNKFTPVLEPFKKNETTFRAALEIKENGKLAFNKLTVEIISQKK
ncbi:type IA DNA topoisomerase [Fibrobacter sp. UBA4309]|uniref:type IA DNA topoisomerase n=1 Tax=Fibrobacter sp. UBA4309 TaxID=1946537 RepID=UPI0025B9956B|nr:DNA topoisomerase [Fibrobacter sp. UBA4309]